MEDANDLESTVASDRSFENDQIDIGQKFSIKIIDEIFSNEWIGQMTINWINLYTKIYN